MSRYYAAALATAGKKNGFGTFHPGFNPEKVSLFLARSSCGNGKKDSTNFPQNAFFLRFWTYHPLGEQILCESAAY